MLSKIVNFSGRRHHKEPEQPMNKEKTNRGYQGITIAIILLVAIVLLTLFPISLNAIITNKWYLEFPIDSDLQPTDWFAFAGSYIGAVGTVVCGWVAYRQNKMMTKQQNILDQQHSQMEQLQGILTKYQIVPNPFFGTLTFEIFDEKKSDFKQEDKEKKAYDLTFGERMPDDLGSCIWMTIELEMTDIIPICNYQIREITCKIGRESYSLLIPKPVGDSNHDSFIQGYGGESLHYHDSIQMMITQKNNLKDSNNIQALFDALGIFCHWKRYPKAGYDSCEWTFEIYLKNQGGHSSTYLVSYQMHQEDNTNGWQICRPRCRRMKDT